MRTLILSKINISEEPGEVEAGTVKAGDKKRCRFLTEEGLCWIQNKLEEASLPYTCRNYPRLNHLVFSTVERIGNLSCPELARLALLNKEKMIFVDHESPDVDSRFVDKYLHVSRDSDEVLSKGRVLFYPIRKACIDIVQERDFLPSERIIILGLSLNRIDNGLKGDSIVSTADIRDLTTVILQDPGLKDSLGKLPSLPGLQLLLLHNLNEEGFIHQGLPKSFRDIYQQCMEGLGAIGDISIEDLLPRFKELAELNFTAFEREHSYILENYLVNRIYTSFFPFGICQNIISEYKLLVVLYALIRVLLICLSGHPNGLTPNSAVRLIQAFVKAIEHNEEKLRKIVEILEKNNHDSIAHLAAMVR